MFMKAPRSAVGFTLIELLTVIAIIAILMSLLMPTAIIVRRKARVASARNDIAGIGTAVKGFYTDYGVYPVPPGVQATGSGSAGNYTFGDQSGSGAQSTNNFLFDVLRAYTGSSATAANVKAENSRLTSYIEPKIVSDATNPKNGITTQTANGIADGTYLDPWGMQYNVRIDLSYSNQLYLSPPYTDSTLAAGFLSFTEAAWSYGPDRQPGTAGNGDVNGPGFDDVLSWK